MAAAPERPEHYVQLRIRGRQESSADLLDIATFLLDLTTLYEVVRLGVNDAAHRFTRFDLYRTRSRVPPVQKLHVSHLRHESPLDLSAGFLIAGGAISAAWLLVQIFERIWNIRLNRHKLRLEIAKLPLELRKAELECERLLLDTRKSRLEVEKLEAERLLKRPEKITPLLEESLRRRDKEGVLPQLEGRLASSKVKIVAAEAAIVAAPPGRVGASDQ